MDMQGTRTFIVKRQTSSLHRKYLNRKKLRNQHGGHMGVPPGCHR